MKNLYDYILASANSALKLQQADGSFPPGVNGPHNQPETPVRVTSHWLITLLKAYEISNKQKYLDASEAAAAYLLLPDHRPYNKTFVCRDLPGLDKVNGLIGQAWVIEALSKASKVLHKKECAELAYTVFNLHPFNHKAGLWEIVDADGSRFRTLYDLVINHQIWFAAAASELITTSLNVKTKEQIKLKVDCFLDNLNKRLGFNRDKTYRHNIKAGIWLLFESPLNYLKTSSLYGNIKRLYKGNKTDLSFGYHAFHTYGLAVLKNTFPKHPVWESAIIREGMHRLSCFDFKKHVSKSKYGIHYNPPGIEVAYTIQSFPSSFGSEQKNLISNWLRWQFSNTWSPKQELMNAVEHDPKTYASRTYEACRLQNYLINL